MMKNHLKTVLMGALALILGTTTAFAQQKVTGTVKDAKGLPVIGAGIVEQGNPTNGAVTTVD